MKRWRFHAQHDEDVLREFPDLPPLLVRLLANRSITTPDDVRGFLAASYDEHLHDPLLFRDMQKVVDRIVRAMDSGERIQLYGDYDVDGVSALAILFTTFRALGYDRVDVYIPDRYKEGYGLNSTAIKGFAGKATLLIACDCGTSNGEEVAEANALGIDVVVVDHHQEPPTLPPAFAFLNSSFAAEPYPFKKLCSSGIALKLAIALLRTLRYGADRLPKPLPSGWEKWLLDFVALATVADMMPLIGENRVLVKHGLHVLHKSRRVGLRALSEVMGTPLERVTTATIGFQIAPRLNAAGRLKHARAAFTLLTTEDANVARTVAAELNGINQERQRLTETVFREALDQAREQTSRTLIVACSSGWSSGIIGLVAGKLKEQYHRPTLVIGEESGTLVGSGRSVQGFDITKALVEASSFLAKFGGHAMACGFTLASAESVEGFLDVMNNAADRDLQERDLTPEIVIDGELPLEDVTWDLVDLLGKLEPFGIGVPEPIFATQRLRVFLAERVGRDGKHLRLSFADDGGRRGKAIGFGYGDWAERLSAGDRLDLAYRVGAHEWNGIRDLQMTVVDLRPSSST
ncbi:MAG: single-stranded-DNA-specific exonuclease RecJ [bacterium]